VTRIGRQMPQEPLSNDDIVARLDGILKSLDEVKQKIKELQVDAKD
jgi:hypothetical protein